MRPFYPNSIMAQQKLKEQKSLGLLFVLFRIVRNNEQPPYWGRNPVCCSFSFLFVFNISNIRRHL